MGCNIRLLTVSAATGFLETDDIRGMLLFDDSINVIFTISPARAEWDNLDIERHRLERNRCSEFDKGDREAQAGSQRAIADGNLYIVDAQIVDAGHSGQCSGTGIELRPDGQTVDRKT